MMHLENHTMLAHLDGELTDAENRAVLEHVAVCAKCGDALAALRADAALVSSAVRARDAREPAHWRDASPAAPTRRAAPLRWAASILLVTATAASAVVIRNAWSDREPPPPDVVPVQTATTQEQAAVIVQPRNGSVRVALSNVGVDSRVRVMFEDRGDASVAVTRAVSDAAAPHFTAEAGRVAIDARGAVAQVNLVLPRAVRDAIVTLDGRTLVTVRGTQVTPAHAVTTGVIVDAVPGPRME